MSAPHGCIPPAEDGRRKQQVLIGWRLVVDMSEVGCAASHGMHTEISAASW
jgi:hypothetical protein